MSTSIVMDFDAFDPDCQSLDDVGTGFTPIKPGRYVLNVINASVNDKNAIVLETQVVGGLAPAEIGKTFTSFFNEPSPHSKDGGRFANQIRARLFAVTGLLTDEMIRQRRCQVNPSQAIGRMFVADVHIHEREDGKQFTSINDAKMWALGDPGVAEVAATVGVNSSPADGAQHAAPAAAAAAAAATTPAPAAQPQSDVDRFGNL